MTRFATLRRSGLLKALAAAFLLMLSQSALAHEVEQKSPGPGFRPESEHSAAFLDALDSATVAVYPTLVRRATRTASSFASQEQIVAFLNEQEVVAAVAAPNRVDLGRLSGSSQWDLFQNDMQRIADALRGWRSGARYHLFMEFLFPVNDQNIFGIQCYIFDEQGRNAFSFLLNSHHRLFVDAGLAAENTSEAARNRLMKKATLVGLTALKEQIEQAREQPGQ